MHGVYTGSIPVDVDITPWQALASHRLGREGVGVVLKKRPFHWLIGLHRLSTLNQW